MAQGGPPLLTDDPGTPGAGRWEINIAWTTEHSSEQNRNELPLVDANYGVGDYVQLKYETPIVLRQQEGAGTYSGLGSSLAGVKWRFYDAGENGWQISTYPQVEFNVTGSRYVRHGLADAGTSYLLPFEFAHIFDLLDVDFDVGHVSRSRHQGDGWFGGVAVGRKVSQRWELVAEVHTEFSDNANRSESLIDVGARCEYSDRFTLLLSAGTDVHDNLGPRNSLLTYVGLQWHP